MIDFTMPGGGWSFSATVRPALSDWEVGDERDFGEIKRMLMRREGGRKRKNRKEEL
jgi:hypothetical protein